MHYLLGHEMRKRYVKTDQWDTNPNHILPTSYNHNYLEVRTDNFARCIQSAQAQLTGLYPPGFGPKLINVYQHLASPPFNVADKKEMQEELKTRALPQQMDPIPVHIYQNDTYTLDSIDVCKKALDMEYKYLGSKEFNDWVQKNYIDSGFQEKLSRIFLSSGSLEFLEAAHIYEWSAVNRAEGYELPAGFDDEIFKKLKEMAQFMFFTAILPNDESVKLQSSGFLYDTIVFFENIINGKTQLKMRLWSGHDTGLTSILKALKLEPYEIIQQPPAFASNIFIELYENDQKQHYILIKYQDIERKSSLCNGLTCTFEQFRDQIYKFISRDVIRECNYQSQQLISYENHQAILLGGSFGLFSIFIVLIYLKKKE